MFNYVLNFFIKKGDELKIEKILKQIDNGEFLADNLDDINILTMTKKFPDKFIATLEVNYDDFVDDLEFIVRLESPNEAYMEEDITLNSFHSSYFFDECPNLYTINVFKEEDRFSVDNILDIVLAKKNS